MLLYQTAIVDLTERKRFEEKLQRSEERYRTLFDLVPVAVYTAMQTESFRNTIVGPLNCGEANPAKMEKSRDSAAPTKSIIPTAATCRTKNALWHGCYAAKN